MVWPRISPITSAWSLALASTPPPAENGTISVIGRVGQSWACVCAVAVSAVKAASAASAARVLVIPFSFAFRPADLSAIRSGACFFALVQRHAAGLDRHSPAFELRIHE